MKVVITLLICLSCFKAYSQDEKAQIRTNLNSYFSLFEKGEYEQTMDFVYPKLLAFVSPDQITSSLKKVFENPDFNMKFSDFEIKDIGNSKTIDNEKFALITYRYKMTMLIKANDANKLKDRFSLLQVYKKRYGEDNVKYDAKEDKYDMLVNKQLYAIASSPFRDWKFIDIEMNQKEFLAKILPPELLTDL